MSEYNYINKTINEGIAMHVDINLSKGRVFFTLGWFNHDGTKVNMVHCAAFNTVAIEISKLLREGAEIMVFGHLDQIRRLTYFGPRIIVEEFRIKGMKPKVRERLSSEYERDSKTRSLTGGDLIEQGNRYKH